jgi:P-type Cu2+ transporter
MIGAATEPCFHCGGETPPEAPYAVQVDGRTCVVCCPGCQAAAQLVLSEGLGRFYQFRTGVGGTPDTAPQNWPVFDREASLRRYTHELPGGEREVSMQLEGLHCAACAWLIENSLRRLDGVREVQVIPGASRAQIRFDARRSPLSVILARIHALGYIAKPMSFTAADSLAGTERRLALQRLAVAGFGMMQVMTFAVSLYAGAMQGMHAEIARLLRMVSLIVATPVVLFAAQPFFAAAWRSLRAGTLGMDVPVATSIGAAYLWSVGATLLGHGPVYFDSAVMFTFFLLLGRYVEMSLRHRSGTQQHALARLLPDSVLRIDGERAERVTPEELHAGDLLRVLPGERIAADGVVETGSSEVDESLLTGESMPCLREPGQSLNAGTLNVNGVLEMRVARVGQDTSLCAVARLLDRAQASRPPIAEQADRFAAWFVGAVLLLAAATGMYWLQVEPARAFPTVLAVLVVTCPCALSLATPAALAAASSRLARLGLLVTNGRALERLAVADRIVFDKTGTLTRGQPRIVDVRLLDAHVSRNRCLAIAAALERFSAHPIAQAFAAITPAVGASEARTAVGRGVEAMLEGVRYRIGTLDYVRELSGAGSDGEPDPSQDRHTLIALGDDQGVLAEFALADGLREDARATLELLRSQGLTTLIASGDRDSAVAAASSSLGGVRAFSRLDAGAKVALVRELQAAGHRVAMVGDGVNDAPVMAAADVSIALGGGTDLAKVSADIVLLGQRLAAIPLGIECARRARRIVRENLCWAALYNATAVPLAASGLLQPWMAAIGMSASSLLVVLNAMRLLKARRVVAGATAPPLVEAPVGSVPA